MKKFIARIVVLLFFIAPAANAQNARIGVSIGFVSAEASGGDQSGNSTTDSRIGFTAGITGDISLSAHFRFQPSLSYVQKGGEVKDDFGKNTVVLNYLEVPFNFVYRTNGTKAHFFTGLGPSLSYALSGKVKVEAMGETQTVSIQFGSDGTDDLKRFEIGGNFLAGCEFRNGLFVAFNYNISFNNIASDPSGTWRNNYGGLKVGYFFGSKH